MELTQLYQFKTVAECGQIKTAADLLYVTPPTLSLSIKKLEEELGAELFDRKSKNRIVLNKTGEGFLSDIAPMFDLLEEAKAGVANCAAVSGPKQSFRIATSVPPAVLPLIKDKIELQYATTVTEQYDLRSDLLSGSFDIAISSRPIAHPKICSRLFLDFRLVLSVPPKHPLFGKDKINVCDLDGYTVIRLPCRRGSVWDRLEQVVKKYHVNACFLDTVDCRNYWNCAEEEDYLLLADSSTESYRDFCSPARKTISFYY